MIKYLKYAIIVGLLVSTTCCTDEMESQEMGGEPIEFEFSFDDHSEVTRGLIDKANVVVYVSPDQGATYYAYTRGVSGRWECNTGSPLRWSGKTMKLWAIVRHDNTVMSSSNTTTTVKANQAAEGFEDSDFLACVGTYTYTTGTVQMTLQHKVAHLVVYVTNCFDASLMACETTAELPTTGQITIGANDVTLSEKSGSATGKIKLYRTSYNTTNNTATFEAYLLPRTTLNSGFKLTCGNTSCITYTTTGAASNVKLEGGKTTRINVGLASIDGNAGTGVWEYSANGEKDAEGFDRQDTGSYQEFTAPCAGRYKLEVWGAQGGSYSDLSYTDKYMGLEGSASYVALSPFINKKFTDYDESKRGIKNCTGGKGAYVTGVVSLNKGDKLYVYVGKAGTEKYTNKNCLGKRPVVATGLGSDYYLMPGGWNGGATAFGGTHYSAKVSTTDATTYNRVNFGGGGGGATDIALIGDRWDSPAHLFSRIIVAGGGGGAMYYPGETGYYDGGSGGGGIFLGTSTWSGGEADGYYTARGVGGSLTQGYEPRIFDAFDEINAYNLINIAPKLIQKYQSEIMKTEEYVDEETGETKTREVGTGEYEWKGDYDYTGFEGSPLTALFGKGSGSRWGVEGVGAGGGGWYGGGTGSGRASNGAGAGGSSYAWTDQYSYDGIPLCDYYGNISKVGFYKFDTEDGMAGKATVTSFVTGLVPTNMNGKVATSKDYDTFMDYIDRKVNPEGQGGVRNADGTLKVAGKYFLTNVANHGGVREGNGFARITLLAE